jgi:acyl carrier protein
MIERIKSIIADQLHVSAIEMLDDDNLIDLGADSLDVVEITMWLEDEFEIDITDDECASMFEQNMTVAQIAELVEGKVQA